jgi:TruD family tRNA pseudouridine synthase
MDPPRSDDATASTTRTLLQQLDAMLNHEVSTHPALQRNYYTIGIGPVFASPFPSHPLPAFYLDPSSATSAGQAIESFLSTELVSDIKTTPSDFIVRELAPRGRKIYGLSDAQIEATMRVADLHPIQADMWTSNNKSSNPSVPSSTESRSSSDLDVQTTTGNTQQSVSMLSPAEILAKELQFTIEGPDACLGALEALHGQAESKLSGQDMPNAADPVLITPTSATDTVQTLDRAAFHHAMRLEFPLLLAESVLRPLENGNQPLRKDQKMYDIRVSIDDRFRDLLPFLEAPQRDLKALNAFFKRKVDRSDASAFLVLRQDVPRDARRTIHQTIHAKTNKSLNTSTITDYKQPDGSTRVAIVVQWSTNAKRRAADNDKKERGSSSSAATAAPHTLFVLKKTQKEHLSVLQLLQRVVKVCLPDIGLAGIKDMQAVTYQFATLANTSPHRLLRQVEFLKSKGVEVGSMYQVDWKLNKGELDGNRFEIVLRNVRRVRVHCNNGSVEETMEVAAMSHIDAMVDRVREYGFVNFYGTQRVGEPGHPSLVGVRGFDIGRAMLKQDYAEAIDLLMTGRLMSNETEVESDEIRAVRAVWTESGGDVNLTYKKLPRNSSMARERAILQGLKRHGKDNPLAAIRNLGYNERIFWVSAYQSYVFNTLASLRLKLHGASVVPGDIVLPSSNDGVQVVTTADCHTYSIFDVVLPLPGYGVQLPTNEVGAMYEQMLKREGVSFAREGVVPESTAKGSYRHVFQKATNLSCTRLDTEPELNVKLCFDLPAGSYATMLLRELMLTTIARVSG